MEGKKGRKLQKIGRERQGETERETERETQRDTHIERET